MSRAHKLKNTLETAARSIRSLTNLGQSHPKKVPIPRLFDARYYREAKSDLPDDPDALWIHFATQGWKHGLDPHPLFDTSWYLSQWQTPDPEIDPLTHYLTVGSKQGLQPNPLFDPRWYLKSYPDAKRSKVEPLAHYVETGWKQGLNPHLLFDVKWHLERYPEVANAGEEPFGNYLNKGWKCGRDPHPLFSVRWYLDLTPEIRGQDIEPLQHYLTIGWKQGKSPHPLFNASLYCRQNSDVREARDEPLTHFLMHGRREGRFIGLVGVDPFYTNERHKALEASAAVFNERYAARMAALDRAKEVILLTTHDMSRSGAPILCLNLSQQLAPKYNIVLLALDGGALSENFEEWADIVIAPHSKREVGPTFLSGLLRHVTSARPVKFAIINSIASINGLIACWENDIPTVQLVHEFSFYVEPQGLMNASAFRAGQQVFSARCVYDYAHRESRIVRSRPCVILPQGRCEAPADRVEPSLRQKEQQTIRTVFRPGAAYNDAVVIVGMGVVQYRKGVDLFIACAQRVRERQPHRPFRFVWIGKGYQPDVDYRYSGYLKDQIERSELTEIVAITDEVTALDIVYEHADILLLSSRLDPLPLVSQDALAHGLPIICFEKATGIAEYLVEDPIASYGVVPYLDLGAAAARICELIDDPELRSRVGTAGKALSAERFSIDRYTSEVERIGCEQVRLKKRQVEDRDVIRRAAALDKDYFCAPSDPRQRELPELYYVTSWYAGANGRKPFAGFHPGIYRDFNEVGERDPLAHYLDAGRPEGPWRTEIIEGGSASAEVKDLRVALHLHLYFTDRAQEILRRLNGIKTPMDLLISVGNEEAVGTVESLLAEHGIGPAKIRVVPNRGRDVGPFLTEFAREICENYEVVGHLHAKKSIDLANEVVGILWSQFLFENLLGGRFAMADAILSRFKQEEKLGLVYPDDPHAVGWGDNYPFAMELGARLGISKLLPAKSIQFPVGNMFWARTNAIKPLLDLGLDWNDYPEEPVPYDGTMLHAIERMIPYVVQRQGYTSKVTHVAQITR
jgi:hypothetical protein